MEGNKVNCEHTYKNNCEALNQALKKEYGILEIYNSVIDECKLPEVKSLLSDLIDDKKSPAKIET